MKKSRAKEMDYWRRCSRRTKLDTINNVDTREENGINVDIVETVEIKMGKLVWIPKANVKGKMAKERYGNGHHSIEGKKEGLDPPGDNMLITP